MEYPATQMPFTTFWNCNKVSTEHRVISLLELSLVRRYNQCNLCYRTFCQFCNKAIAFIVGGDFAIVVVDV